MSGTLSVYAVDCELVRSMVGSRNEAELKRMIQSIQPQFADALTELFTATGPYRAPASELAHAHEHLCSQLGRELPNDAVASTSLTQLESFDGGLKAADLGISLLDLMYGGGPIQGLPRPDDFPSTGMWSRDVVATALLRFEASNPESEDPLVDDLLVCIGDWLRVAGTRKVAVVGFYY